MHPRQMRETLSPVAPSLTYCIANCSLLTCDIYSGESSYVHRLALSAECSVTGDARAPAQVSRLGLLLDWNGIVMDHKWLYCLYRYGPLMVLKRGGPNASSGLERRWRCLSDHTN